MTKMIKIGTRESELAMWQAQRVRALLAELGFTTQIIPIGSAGDVELEKPLYEMGITGIFTKTLDIALLREEIDIAVHSLKDVPTALPDGIVQAAVLERADPRDVFVYKDTADVMTPYDGLIATGSLRRKAQWLNRYKKHEVVNLRGNVNTRLEKLEANDWHGAIFAAAGLQRLDKLPDSHTMLDWMVPAPAQGGIMIAARELDIFVRDACTQINHEETELCTRIERAFLRELEGGCTAPIGALATIKSGLIKNGDIEFTGVLLSRDGQTRLEVTKSQKIDDPVEFGKMCAQELIAQGAKDIMAADETETEKANRLKAEAARARSKKVELKTVPKKQAEKQPEKQAGKQTGDASDLTPEDVEAPEDVETKSPEIKTAKGKQADVEGVETETVQATQILDEDFEDEDPGDETFYHEPESSMYTVLSTRALSDEHLGLAGKNISVQGLDFIATQLLPIPPEAVRTDSMIITSQATVRSLLASFPRLNLRFKNIYCVGKKTQQMVEDRFGRVLYTAPNAHALAVYLCNNMSGRAITYFCGNLRRDDLPKMLRANHIKVTEIPAYETKYTGRKIDSEFSGVMFYSPSGVRSYVQANPADKIAFCIGATTAHEAQTYFKDVKMAARPTIEDVLDLVNKHYA